MLIRRAEEGEGEAGQRAEAWLGHQSLGYETMPRDQGQIVTVSYALGADNYLYRRTFDSSDRSTWYARAAIDWRSPNSVFEPQNGILPKHRRWEQHEVTRGGRGQAAHPPGPSVMGVRVFDQGSEVRVTADEWFVYDWRQRWPASGLPDDTGVSFTFDKRNGDLTDYAPQGKLQHADGGAVNALADDLRKIAWTRLGLSTFPWAPQQPEGSRAESSAVGKNDARFQAAIEKAVKWLMTSREANAIDSYDAALDTMAARVQGWVPGADRAKIHAAIEKGLDAALRRVVGTHPGWTGRQI